ncbi:MAG: SDR family NAD(P)-dependent oxidoreductase [Actinobacteria bacterium]|nr:SDR family NAD(P)-dependent oxidoreductase [Actinomycetota bacterium]
MREKINGKTILITGASSGIGYELARQLAERDCRLILIARRDELLRQLIDSLPDGGEKHRYYKCDVSDQGTVETVCRDILNSGTVIDIFILNAGVSSGYKPPDLDIENIKLQFDVNFWGVLYFLKYLLPPMIERNDGLVAATGSPAGYRGMPKSAPYSASKAALDRFMESLRIDFWSTNVHFTLITPGFVKSPMTDSNDFYMPFLMPVEKAVKIIIKGLEKKKPEICFPLRLCCIAKFARILPPRFYASIMQNRRK